MSNNFSNYVFIYLDANGIWNQATNPVFIAEHKQCRAVEKAVLPYGSVKIYLENLNNKCSLKDKE